MSRKSEEEKTMVAIAKVGPSVRGVSEGVQRTIWIQPWYWLSHLTVSYFL